MRSRLLSELAVGEGGRLVRVSDRDPSWLRYLDSVEIGLGTVVRVIRRVPSAGVIELEVRGAEVISLSPEVATAMWVGDSLAETV